MTPLPGPPPDVLNADRGLNEWCVLHGFRGSIAHGMYVPSDDPDSIDDRDTMAVCVPSPSHYLGLLDYGSRGTREVKRGEWDVVIYEARKAIRLLAQGNPNVLGLLWLRPEHYIAATDSGKVLVTLRDFFTGRHVYRSFAGYARGQLQKMERGAFEGYMGERRRALVERHGYDTKNAAHLIRLLRMGTEYLATGQLNVWREDADELLAVKRGEWTLARVKREAERGFAAAGTAYHNSDLPDRPDPEVVNRICVNVVSYAIEDAANSPTVRITR